MINSNSLNKQRAAVFAALAHPVRLDILELLGGGEACVCHIQNLLQQRQAYISQQLNVLRSAGLVDNRKDGLLVYYFLSDPLLLDLLDSAREWLVTSNAWVPEHEPTVLSATICTCPACSGLSLPTDLVEFQQV